MYLLLFLVSGTHVFHIDFLHIHVGFEIDDVDDGHMRISFSPKGTLTRSTSMHSYVKKKIDKMCSTWIIFHIICLYSRLCKIVDRNQESGHNALTAALGIVIIIITMSR